MRGVTLGLTVATMLVGRVASAQTYWVSPDGAADWSACQSPTPLGGADACALGTANANASAGDTVRLRGGTYAGVWIEPAQSGASETRRIVFTGHDSEEAVVRDANRGIYLRRRSYVTVNRITFFNVGRFLRILGGQHNTISNCDFDQIPAGSEEWSASSILSDTDQESDDTAYSTHNWVHHCSFHHWAYGAYDEHRGGLLSIGRVEEEDYSSFNLIEENTFAYGGHHTIGVYSQYNVIRNNYTHNETNADEWDFEGYRAAITEGPSAGRCLYEGNRFGVASASGLALRSGHNILRFNSFYENGKGALQIVPSPHPVESNRIYHNTFFHNGHLATASSEQGGIYFCTWEDGSPVDTVVKNNLFVANRNGAVTYVGTVEPQIIDNNWSDEGDPLFVDVASPVDPMVYPPSLPDFHLQPQSSCIDRAVPLTTIVTESGSGSEFQVEDAGYFMDGWGIVDGDRIQLEGDTQVATVTHLDYDTNTLTVDQALSFARGQGVSLAYVGAAPDLGAFEYAQPDACSQLGGTCCASGEVCAGGAFEVASDCAGRCCVGGTCEERPETGGAGGVAEHAGAAGAGAVSGSGEAATGGRSGSAGAPPAGSAGSATGSAGSSGEAPAPGGAAGSAGSPGEAPLTSGAAGIQTRTTPGGASPSGQSGSEGGQDGTPPNSNQDADENEGGCGCRQAGSAPSSPSGAIVAALLSAVAAGSRRRRRPPITRSPWQCRRREP